jgi:hypothetical protein
MKRIVGMFGTDNKIEIEVLQADGKEVLLCEGVKFYSDKSVTEYAQKRLREMRRLQCQG